MLRDVAEKLDRWIAAENVALRRDGLPRLAPCRIRVVGQMALFEQQLPLHLVATQVAEPEAVLVSKALKAPLKNRALITEYLAQGPSDRFLALAARYKLDLQEFL